MAKATGLGGVFLRAKNALALAAWYEKHLGISYSQGCFTFPKETQRAYIAVAFFSQLADYFPARQQTMLTFQVDDLEAVLYRLALAGVEVEDRREQYEYGTFGWFTDPEGNRVELWEPKD